jgi:hypothetical protein
MEREAFKFTYGVVTEPASETETAINLFSYMKSQYLKKNTNNSV